MVGILDMAPVAEKVSIRGKEIPVIGLPLEDIIGLLAAFPDAAALASGGLNAGKLLMAAPELVAAAICLATGEPGTPENIATIRRWPAGDQVKILNAVIRLTASDGIGPFVELATTFISGLEAVGDQVGKESATPSPRRSRAAAVSATRPPK